MSKITEQLMNEAGLSNEQATKTLAVFTNYLKAKFPKALHPEIDSIMNDGSFGDAFKGNLKDFGGKAEETAKDVANKADEIFSEMGDKLRDIFKPKK